MANSGHNGMPSFLADALQRVHEMGVDLAEARQQTAVRLVRSTETTEYWLQDLGGGMPAAIVEADRPRNAVKVEHHELESFAAWVQRHSGAVGRLPMVFVDAEQVTAAWNLSGHTARDVARLQLRQAEAWKALQVIQKPLGQKVLHRLLTTDLHGHLDEALALMVAQLSFTEKAELAVEIHRAGLADVRGAESLRLFFSGGDVNEEADVPVEWEYQGPVWTCFDTPITVPMRLVLSKPKDQGLQFEFSAMGLEARMIAYRDALAETVEKLLGGEIPVYQGYPA